MPREMWFDSVAALEAYWERSMQGGEEEGKEKKEFVITAEAQALAHTLLLTCVFPWWMAWAVPFGADPYGGVAPAPLARG